MIEENGKHIFIATFGPVYNGDDHFTKYHFVFVTSSTTLLFKYGENYIFVYPESRFIVLHSETTKNTTFEMNHLLSQYLVHMDVPVPGCIQSKMAENVKVHTNVLQMCV